MDEVWLAAELPNHRRGEKPKRPEVLRDLDRAGLDGEREDVSVMDGEDEAGDGVARDLDLNARGAGLLALKGSLQGRDVAVEVLGEDEGAAGLLRHLGQERAVCIVPVLDERRSGDRGASLLDGLQDVGARPDIVAAVRHEEQGESASGRLLRHPVNQLGDLLERLLEPRHAGRAEPAVDGVLHILQVREGGDRLGLEEDARLPSAAEPDYGDGVLVAQELRKLPFQLFADLRKLIPH